MHGRSVRPASTLGQPFLGLVAACKPKRGRTLSTPSFHCRDHLDATSGKARLRNALVSHASAGRTSTPYRRAESLGGPFRTNGSSGRERRGLVALVAGVLTCT